jgi:hypothetical protein
MDGVSRLRFSGALLALILINFVPVAGVLFFDWSVFEVMLTFWAENVVIGLVNVLRLVLAGILRRDLMGLFGLVSFSMTFVPFTAAHGLFVLLMFGGLMDRPFDGDPFLSVFNHLLDQHWLVWPAAMLALLHLGSFALRDIRGGELWSTRFEDMIGRPIARLALLHLTVIFGGWAVMMLGSHIGALLVLVALKSAFDISVLAGERQRRPDSADLSTVARIIEPEPPRKGDAKQAARQARRRHGA